MHIIKNIKERDDCNFLKIYGINNLNINGSYWTTLFTFSKVTAIN